MNQLNERITVHRSTPRRRPRLVCVFAGDEDGDCIVRVYSRRHGRRRMRVHVRQLALSTGLHRGDFLIAAFVVPEGNPLATLVDAEIAARRIAHITDRQETGHEPTE